MKRVNISPNTKQKRRNGHRLGTRALSLMLSFCMAVSLVVLPQISASAYVWKPPVDVAWTDINTDIVNSWGGFYEPPGTVGDVRTKVIVDSFGMDSGYTEAEPNYMAFYRDQNQTLNNPDIAYWNTGHNSNNASVFSRGDLGNTVDAWSVNGITFDGGDVYVGQTVSLKYASRFDYESCSLNFSNQSLVSGITRRWFTFDSYYGNNNRWNYYITEVTSDGQPKNMSVSFKAENPGDLTLTFNCQGKYYYTKEEDYFNYNYTYNVVYHIKKYNQSLSGVANKTLYVGDNTSTGVSTNGNGDLNYYGYDPNIINISNGKIYGIGAGTTTVKVKAAETNAYYASGESSFTVTVNKKQAAISGYGDKTLTYGESTPVGATTNSGAALQYSSSNSKVATVEGGYVVAKGVGEATITITSPETNNWLSDTKTFHVTVNKAQGQISNYKPMDIIYGQEISLGVSGNNTDSNGGLQYSTSDPDYVTVNESGYIKGVDVGEADITITSPETANWKKDEKTVHVKVDKAPAGIHTSDMTVTYNDSKNMNATADSGSTFEFKSNNTDLFDVDKYRGDITGKRVGKGTVDVTTFENDHYYGDTKTYNVEITQAKPTINAEDVRVDFEETPKIVRSITETDWDSTDTDDEADRDKPDFTFKSSDENVVKVDEDGVIETVNVGQATVRVTSKNTHNYAPNYKDISVKIDPATPIIKSDSLKYRGTVNSDDPIEINAISNTTAQLKYSSEDETIATVDQAGHVWLHKEAQTNITIAADPHGNYLAPEKRVVTVSGIAGVPGKVVTKAQSGEDGQITVTWDPPVNNGGRRIVNYLVQRSADDAPYENVAFVNSFNTRYVDKDVTNGIEYSYVIKAINTVGEGVASDPVTARAYGSPDAPAELKIDGTSDTSVNVSWKAPENNGGDEISSYTVRVFEDELLRKEITEKVTIGGQEYNEETEVYTKGVSGLSRGTGYTFTVTANNAASAAGAQAPYSAVRGYTWDNPTEPLNLAGESGGRGSINLTWDKPVGGHGAPISEYVLQYRKRGELDWAEVRDITEPHYEFEQDSLDPNNWYYFKVKAINPVGEGEFCEPYYAIPSRKPDGPNLLDADGGDNSVIISASVDDDNGHPVEAYGVYYRIHGREGAQLTKLCDLYTRNGRLSKMPAEGLRNGTTYDIAITAVNESGESDFSRIVEVTPGKPGAVENLKVLPMPGRLVAISYDPAEGHGSDITSYDLYISGTNNGVQLPYERINITETEYKIYTGENLDVLKATLPNSSTKLDSDEKMTEYSYDAGERLNGDKVSVYAVANNAISRSDACETVVAGVGVPTTPVMTSYKVDDDGLHVNWSKSEHNGNALYGYTVVVTDNATRVPTNFDVNNSTFSLTIPEGSNSGEYPFVEGKQYEVKVYARNSAGDSQYSNVGKFTYATPSRPLNVQGEPKNEAIVVSWNKPEYEGTSGITGYYIYLNEETEPTLHVTWKSNTSGFRLFSDGDDDGPYTIIVTDLRILNDYNQTPVEYTVQDNLDSFEIEVDGLANGFDYSARVTAENDIGEGIEAGTGEMDSPFTMPDAPVNLRTKAVSGSEIDVMWSAPYNNGGSPITEYIVTGYKVAEKNSSTGEYETLDEPQQIPVQRTTEQNITVNGLTSGAAYQFKVAAVTEVGTGAYTELSGTTKTLTAPSKPTITKLVSGVGEENVPLTVSWDAPVSDGDSAILGYDIYINGTMKMNLNGLISASAREYTINDLRLSTANTYDVTVVAYNAVTGTAYSNGVKSDSKSVLLGTVPPPENIKTTTSRATGDLYITWDDLASKYGDYFSRYTVYIDGKLYKVLKENELTVQGLNFGKALTIEITAINKNGEEGSKSEPYIVMVGGPSKVNLVSANTYSQISKQNLASGVYVKWNPVDTNATGNFAVTHYAVYADDELVGLFENNDSIKYNANVLHADVTGIDGDKEHNITVAAVNKYGTGERSNAIAVTTITKLPAIHVTDIRQEEDDLVFDVDVYGDKVKRYMFIGEWDRTGRSLGDSFTFLNQNSFNSDATKPLYMGRIEGNTVHISNAYAWSHVKFKIYASSTYTGSNFNMDGAIEYECDLLKGYIPPQNVKVVPGNGKATLSFDSGNVRNYDGVTGYKIYQDGELVQTVLETGDGDYTVDFDNLENGREYSYTVTTYGTIKSGNFVSEESKPSDAVTVVPGIPGTPIIKNVIPGNKVLTVQWFAPDANGGRITKYKVYVNGSEALETPLTKATLTGLTNGTDYSIQIRAVNQMGEGGKTDTVIGTPGTIPDVVTNVKAEPLFENDQSKIVITWDEPDDNGGSAITKYNVYGKGSIEVMNESRTAIVTGLDKGTTYSYEIAAENKVGEGYSYTTRDVKTYDLPSAPIYTGGDSSNNVLKAVWKAPENDGGTEILNYIVYATPASGGSPLMFSCYPTPDENGEMSKILEGKLVTGESYSLAVSAVNVVGESEKSGSDRMEVITDLESSEPTEPLEVTATGKDNTATVLWSAPEFDGNSVISGYQIWAGNTAEDMGYLATVDGYTTTYTERGIANNEERFYKVKALTEAFPDGGPFSKTVSVIPRKTVAPTAPAWVEFNNETGASAYKVDATGNSMTLNWNASTADEYAGQITYSIYVNKELKDTVTDTTYVLTGLKPNTQYDITVKAETEAGGESSSDQIRAYNDLNIVKGDASQGFTYGKQYENGVFAYIDANYNGVEDSIATNSAPSEPSNIFVDAGSHYIQRTSTGSAYVIDIWWDEPIDDGGLGIDGYIINIDGQDIKVPGENKWEGDSSIQKDCCAYITDEMLQSVKYGKPFAVYVKAYNSFGESGASEAVYYTNTPSRPLKTQLLDIENGSDITIGWYGDHHKYTTGYNLYINGVCQPLSLDQVENIQINEGAARSYTYHGNIGEVYQFAVSAVYDDIESELSPSLTVDLRETIPTAPQNVLVIPDPEVAGKATLKWDAPANAADANIARYVIYENGEEQNIELSADDKETELTLDTSALLKVAAVTANGTYGDASAPVKYKMPTNEEFDTNTPPAPTDPGYTLKRENNILVDADDNVTITWKTGITSSEHTEPTESYNIFFNIFMGDNAEPVATISAAEAGGINTYTFRGTPNTDYDITIQPVGANGEIGPSGNVYFNIPKNGYTAPDKPVLNADVTEDKEKVTFTWTEKAGETYNLIANGDRTNKIPVTSGYEYALAEKNTNYTFILEAVKTYADGETTSAESDMVTVNTNVVTEIDESYESNKPVITGTIANSQNKVKVFWDAPEKREGETGDIAKYKIAVDGVEQSYEVPADRNPLVYTVDFGNSVSAKKVEVKAYKEVNGQDIFASVSDAVTISPLKDVVSDNDFDNNNKDAQRIDPDTQNDQDPADKPVITNSIANGSDVKIFWDAPANDNGEITHYKAVIDGVEQSDSVNAADPHVYNVAFGSETDTTKTVRINAYKTEGGSEVFVSQSDPWRASPEVNQVSDEDFAEDKKDADVTGPKDENGNGIPDDEEVNDPSNPSDPNSLDKPVITNSISNGSDVKVFWDAPANDTGEITKYKAVIDGVEQSDAVNAESTHVYTVSFDGAADNATKEVKINAYKTEDGSDIFVSQSDPWTVSPEFNKVSDEDFAGDKKDAEITGPKDENGNGTPDEEEPDTHTNADNITAADKPVITNYIANGNDVKVFWNAPESDNGTITKYKAVVDGFEKTDAVSAGSDLVYTVSFDGAEAGATKEVKINAYKTENGSDVFVSQSDPWTVSPELNQVSNEDFAEDNKDAEITGPKDEDGSGVDDEQEAAAAGKPVITNYISDGSDVKVFWNAPENDNGEITKYKAVVDGAEQSDAVSAGDTLVYKVTGFDGTNSKEVKINAYKTEGGSDVFVSQSDPWTVSPEFNKVSEQDFEDNKKDAEIEGPKDEDGDAAADEENPENPDDPENPNDPEEPAKEDIRVVIGNINVEGAHVVITDQNGNEIADVEISMVEAGGVKKPAEFLIPQDKLTEDMVLSFKVAKDAYTSYTVNKVPYADLEAFTTLGMEEVELYVGDLNDDDKINTQDMTALKKNMGVKNTVDNPIVSQMGDLNSDKKINTADLTALKKNYGKKGTKVTWTTP